MSVGWGQSATTGLALASVLALILMLSWVRRKFPMTRLAGRAAGSLVIRETLAIDARRRLHLVDVQGAQALLLTGNGGDILIPWRAPAAPGQPVMRRLAAWLGVLLLLLMPGLACAQSVAIDLGHAGDASATARLVQITALFTVLSLAPSLLVMVTAFTRIVIVLSLLRSALGAQGTPPNIVLIGLALFLSFFVMQPTLDAAWASGIKPMMDGSVEQLAGMKLACEPFRHFMAVNLRPADLSLFETIGHLPPAADADHAAWRSLIPAFLVGELRRAFEMGFLLYLPFTIIDLVVSSVLMSLGMMMLPPSGVSLPFKLIFFVMADGWRLVAGSLAQSFAPS